MPAPSDLARLIHDVLTEGGFDADAETIAQQVRRLEYGLPAEDEFSVLCAWLGRCQLIHKLDQKQTPHSSREIFQVPDLLARFEIGGPVLIEVKTSTKPSLSFKQDYHSRLVRYADMLGLPLLIAWKFHSVWTLFDIRDAALASRNFNIRFDQAMGQNLLGVLAGDLAYKLQPGAGIHLRINKEELLSAQPSDDGYTETWKMRIGAVDFTRADGERSALHAETTQLLATWELESREDHHADHIIHSFVVPKDTNVQFAHRALVQLLTWENQNMDSTGWRALLSVPEITRTIGRLSEALDRGLQEGVVSHVFLQQPGHMPDFLTVSAPSGI